MATTRDLAREMDAARVLKEQIAALAGDDPDFIRDSIEGETSLLEIIGKLVADDGEDEALLDGIKQYSDALDGRAKRIKDRKELRRAMLATALDVIEQKKLETPCGTISRTAIAPKPIIADEAEIPSRFWKQPAPVLDKKSLSDALKAGEQIPGAALSNGGATITIRRK